MDSTIHQQEVGNILRNSGKNPTGKMQTFQKNPPRLHTVEKIDNCFLIHDREVKNLAFATDVEVARINFISVCV